jgi:hypothetical protein
MEKIADLKVFNDTFIEMVRGGQVKEAAASAQNFTRMKLREESFAEKILSPMEIANDELDKAENPELQVKWNDREPDAAPAMTVPLGVVPDSFQFGGSRYPVYFSRIVSPLFKKDVDKLRGYDYDIRSTLLDISTKDIAAEIDSKFMSACVSAVTNANANNGGLGSQDITVGAALTKDSLSDAFAHIQKLRVPFGPLQADGNSSKGVMLMNNITARHLLKFDASEIGFNLAEKTFTSGVPSPSILGVKTIFTLKREIVPDNVVMLFSSEEFLGKYLRLQPLTVFMENKSYFLQFFQYTNIGISIGNIKGVVRLTFA